MFKLALLIFVCSCISFGGFERTPSGPRIRGMGGTAITVGGEVWNITANPALLNTLGGGEGSVLYVPGQFGLGELSVMAAGIMTKLGRGGGALTVRSFGFDLYREYSATLSFGYPAGILSLGVSVNYFGVTISRYGSAAALGVDAGCTVEVLPGFMWALVLGNVNSPLIGESREPLPHFFCSGISFQPVTGGLIAAEYRKEAASDPTLSVGIEYQVVGDCFLRCGISDVPAIIGTGFGVRISSFSFDYAASFHQELGLTHALSVSVRWGSDTP